MASFSTDAYGGICNQILPVARLAFSKSNCSGCLFQKQNTQSGKKQKAKKTLKRKTARTTRAVSKKQSDDIIFSSLDVCRLLRRKVFCPV